MLYCNSSDQIRALLWYLQRELPSNSRTSDPLAQCTKCDRTSIVNMKWTYCITSQFVSGLRLLSSAQYCNNNIDGIQQYTKIWFVLLWRWAPSVGQVSGPSGDYFVLYHVAHDKRSNRQAVGQATSKTPYGPFEPTAEDAPFLNQVNWRDCNLVTGLSAVTQPS